MPRPAGYCPARSSRCDRSRWPWCLLAPPHWLARRCADAGSSPLVTVVASREAIPLGKRRPLPSSCRRTAAARLGFRLDFRLDSPSAGPCTVARPGQAGRTERSAHRSWPRRRPRWTWRRPGMDGSSTVPAHPFWCRVRLDRAVRHPLVSRRRAARVRGRAVDRCSWLRRAPHRATSATSSAARVVVCSGYQQGPPARSFRTRGWATGPAEVGGRHA